jgi:hypothetical protein
MLLQLGKKAQTPEHGNVVVRERIHTNVAALCKARLRRRDGEVTGCNKEQREMLVVAVVADRRGIIFVQRKKQLNAIQNGIRFV